jgi:acetolactate synthase-1/2/3 large subunit
MKITKHDELDKAMDDAFAMKDRLVFMDIYVDPSEHVYPMHIADGTIRDMWLSKTERT